MRKKQSSIFRNSSQPSVDLPALVICIHKPRRASFIPKSRELAAGRRQQIPMGQGQGRAESLSHQHPVPPMHLLEEKMQVNSAAEKQSFVEMIH